MMIGSIVDRYSGRGRMSWLAARVLIALLGLAALGASAGAVNIELGQGNFDYSNGGWILLDGGGGEIFRQKSNAAFQTGSVRIVGSATHSLSKQISTVGYSTVQVMYWTNGINLDSNDTFLAQWSGDGGATWNTFQTLPGDVYDDDWVLQSFTLAGAGNRQDFILRFVFESTYTDDEWYIDEIMVLGDGRVLEYGDFAGTFDGWTATDGGEGTLHTVEWMHHDFQIYAYGWGAHRLQKNIDTTGLINVEVSYYLRGIGLEEVDTFTAEWSADGGASWNLLESLAGTAYQGAPENTWRRHVFSLPVAAANNPNFTLRFTFDGDHWTDSWYIDQIEVDGDFGIISGLSLSSDSPTTVGNPTTFMAQVVSGQVNSYDWDFGDGSPVVTTGSPFITHTYLTSGVFSATVTAHAAFESQSVTTAVNVRDVPIAGLTLTQGDSVVVGQTAVFTASISAGSGITYSWDFGDGTPPLVNGPQITHVYAAAGTYTVSVVAANSENTASESAQIMVQPLSEPDLFKIYLPFIRRKKDIVGIP
ncbi:MAG: PKD domain-containing protein [Anaerolineae bacterium]